MLLLTLQSRRRHRLRRSTAGTMSIRLTSNVAAQTPSRHTAQASLRFSRSAERVASGLRVNAASDDAASLTVSQKLRAQLSGATIGRQNAQLGIAMVRTADAALQEAQTMLHRMRELATQAANGTLTGSDSAALDAEIQAPGQGIDHIGQTTEFNGHQLLVAPAAPPPPPPNPAAVDPSSEMQTGTTISNGGQSAMVTAIDVTGAQAGTTFTVTATGGHRVALTRSSDGAFEELDLNYIVAGGSDTLAFSTLGVSISVTSAAGIQKTRLTDALTDPANDTVVTAPAPPSPPSSTPAGRVIGVGADSNDTVTVPFEDLSLSALGLTSPLATFSASHASSDAQSLITAAASASDAVSAIRVRLGAMQNRLEHTASFLAAGETNLEASYGRIVDADVASESVNLARARILSETNTAIAAHTRAVDQRVLQLLNW
jgi:flagellin